MKTYKPWCLILILCMVIVITNCSKNTGPSQSTDDGDTTDIPLVVSGITASSVSINWETDSLENTIYILEILQTDNFINLPESVAICITDTVNCTGLDTIYGLQDGAHYQISLIKRDTATGLSQAVFKDTVTTLALQLPDSVVQHYGTITTAEEWYNGKIHRVSGVLYVEGIVTIMPGTIIEMEADAVIEVTDGGGIMADGTENTILFTGTVKQKGWWGCIEFSHTSTYDKCHLINCTVEYGGGEGVLSTDLRTIINANIVCNNSNPTIKNCIIRHSASCGVYIDINAKPVFLNNYIYQNTTIPISSFLNATGYIGNGRYLNNGYDYIYLREGTIYENTVLANHGVVYVCDGGLISNATLYLGPGVSLYMTEGSLIKVGDNGGLFADGNDGDIYIGGSVDQKGWWGGIEFSEYANDGNCVLNKCTIDNGGGVGVLEPNLVFLVYGNIICNDASPKITHCIVKNSSAAGVYLHKQAQPVLTNNTITMNNGNPIIAYFNGVEYIGKGAYTGNSSGYDCIYIEKGSITRSCTWVKHDVPYLLSGGTIASGVLTIAPGTVIYMTESARISVEAGTGLIADGSVAKITITGSAAVPGWWNSIVFEDKSLPQSSKLINCIIEYGGGEEAVLSYDLLILMYGSIICNNSSPHIEDCIIQNSETWGINVRNKDGVVPVGYSDGNEFYNNATGDIGVSKGSQY